MENWQHKDITFKQLIDDFGFPLPQYEYQTNIYGQSPSSFNSKKSSLKAASYLEQNPMDLKI